MDYLKLAHHVSWMVTLLLSWAVSVQAGYVFSMWFWGLSMCLQLLALVVFIATGGK